MIDQEVCRHSLSDELRKWSRVTLALATASVAFWPAFLVITVIENHFYLGSFAPSNGRPWAPIILTVFLSGVFAPWFSRNRIRAKARMSFALAASFIALYAFVAHVGVAFAGWGD